MSLLDKFFSRAAAPAAETERPSRPKINEVFGKTDRKVDISFRSSSLAVSDSPELKRVLALPRRLRPTEAELAALQDAYTARLGKPLAPCSCEKTYLRRCAKRLLPIQAWALEEISRYEGLLGPIGVGDGKTLLDLLAPMVMPNCKVAVLLVRPDLREQLLKVDWNFYGQHWELPNLAGGSWFKPGKPVLHVVAFSELSGAKATDLLTKINPDLIIADEGQALRNPTSARCKRYLRYFSERPETRLCIWSGTLTSKGLADFAHHSRLALGAGSPAPLDWPTVEEWAGALDPGDWPTPIGALERLCEVGETARSGFHRRLVDTPGVVSSPETGNCQAALTFYERKIEAPEKVKAAVRDLELTWERPDGEALVEALAVARCARELACGFYYRWKWIHGETDEAIQKWLEARKAWNKELREKLKRSKEHLDSPLLCAKAAIRWHHGYVHIERDAEGRELARRSVPPRTGSGPLPTWAADCWPEWERLRDTCSPVTEPVWVDDYLVRDAVEWARSSVGIVWYEHDCFGRAVAKGGSFPLYGPGADASRDILGERGERSIVASIRAHGTGKNLQPFCRQLVANPPADGATWEQLIGRTHRQGQLEDEVTVHVYRHMPVMVTALDKARELAQYIQDTLGGSQKLLRASFIFG